MLIPFIAYPFSVIVLVGRLHFVRLHYNLELLSASPIPSYYTIHFPPQHYALIVYLSFP